MGNVSPESHEIPDRKHIVRLADELGFHLDDERVDALGEQIDAHISTMKSVTELNTNELEPAGEFHLDEPETAR